MVSGDACARNLEGAAPSQKNGRRFISHGGGGHSVVADEIGRRGLQAVIAVAIVAPGHAREQGETHPSRELVHTKSLTRGKLL